MRAWKVKLQKSFLVNQAGEIVYYGHQSEYVPVNSVAEARSIVESKKTKVTDMYRWTVVEAPQKVLEVEYAGDGFLTLKEICEKIRRAIQNGKIILVDKWNGMAGECTEKALALPEPEGSCWEPQRFRTPLEALYYVENGRTCAFGQDHVWIFCPSLNNPPHWEEHPHPEIPEMSFQVWAVGWSRPADGQLIENTPAEEFSR